MNIQDIMTTNVYTIEPDNTVMDAAKIMQKHNIGSIPVCDSNKNVIGIITDRDIIVRNLANEGNPETTHIKNLMTKDVIFGNPDMSINDAGRIMAQNKIRRLPIVQNQNIVGMVTLGDLATRQYLIDEAADALSNISQPSRPIN